jgi:hypothetical protein
MIYLSIKIGLKRARIEVNPVDGLARLYDQRVGCYVPFHWSSRALRRIRRLAAPFGVIPHGP